jgi:hypothetical protein
MIKGLAITPPVLGRISIGKIAKRMANDCLKRMINLPLPAKSKIRMVLKHPLDEQYVPKHKTKNSEHSSTMIFKILN